MILSTDQQSAVNKLEKLRVGALFMEPGTGKTLTALKLIESSKADWVLFIVPFQTKQNLQDELTKWDFKMPYRIEGVESLSNSDRLYLELMAEVKKHKKTFMVVDESLKIKNRTAKRTQRIMELGSLSYYRLILNGTPISKNILDLWTQMEFLSPKILKMRFNQFKDTFIEYKYFPDKGRTIYKDQYNIDYLYSLIEPYVFDAKLNLEISKLNQKVEYSISNTDEYQEIRADFLFALSDMRDVEFLAYTQKMQMSYTLDSGKIKCIDKLLKDNPEPTILFCKYVKTQDYLRERYPQCKVLTYGKGTFGLNLQAYKNMIFVDKTWDYAQLEQAQRRIYRIGQENDVKFFYLTGDVGLEKMIDKCIRKKTSILDEFKKSSKEELANVI
ncbi:DEAD/DEAH box helicase [Lactobacillus salivarius]|uniref:SNF2-related protein n=1 Tax=Ligilactobacillus salivarius TaxID=1624 RepID=UPI00136ECC72|nr:DEAD/DEAH box helicase [Ligilactobacillus salivarius]MYZ65048.1 DEAD/DEAH box helicase [Ligilactobacillus salivarius]